MREPLRLLAVLAHPDDEALGLGGPLAKYAAEGIETYLLTATRGERGWAGAAADDPGPQALGRIREGELRRSASILGVCEARLLDLLDGELDQAEPKGMVAQIAAHIRRLRPQVVVTFSPDGSYGHPDHIAISQFTTAAIVSAADAADPRPHRVAKLYYMVVSRTQVEALRRLTGGIQMLVDGVTRSGPGWEDWAITTRVDASPYAETAWQAILCHQTQQRDFLPLAAQPDFQQSFWKESSFYRAFSLVNGGRQVERDLFAGLR